MAFIPIERTSCLDSAINIDRLSGAMFTQENEAHQFVITCTQNNAQLTLTGTITAKVVQANGNTVELVGTIDGGKAVVTLTQPCYNTAGRIQISIFNTVGSTKLCIYAAIAYVQTAEHGDLIDGSQIIDSVEDLIADIQAAVATIPPDYSTLSNQVADLKSAFNSSNTAFENANVLYNGTVKNTGTNATFWMELSPNPIKTPENSTIYVYLKDYTGVLATGNDLLRIIVYYTDSTNTYKDFKETREWDNIVTDSSKTISYLTARLKRSDSTLSEAVETSYSFIITDTKPISVEFDEYKFETNSALSAVENEINVVNSELKSAFDDVFAEVNTWADLSPLSDVDSDKTNNYYLTGLGGCELDTSLGVRLFTYPVTEGTMMHLTLSKDTDGVYQWQDSKVIDRGDGYIHAHVIGTPVTEATDADVIVPDGATYLIVSQYQANTTNKVQIPSSRIEPIEDKLDNIFQTETVVVTDHERDKYINKTGGVSNYVGYTAYSELIPVKKGDIIKARLYCNPNMAAISYVTADYLFKRPAVIGRSYIVEEYTLTSDHTGWVCLSYYMDYEHTCTIQRNTIDELNNYHPLRNKFIVWCGDSIMRGNTWNDTNDGWAGRVADRYGCRFKNYGVGGSTICNNVPSGATPTIYSQIETAHTEYPNADYIIFDGGTNDADLIGSVIGGTTPTQFGSFSETDWSGSYDTDTFCGAMETICMHLSQYWLGKHIGYIVPHKQGVSNDYSATGNNRRAYYETAIKICKKWGISVLNLWDGCYMNPKHNWMCDTDNTMTAEEIYAAGYLYADRQHLTSAGYDYEGLIVGEWINSL